MTTTTHAAAGQAPQPAHASAWRPIETAPKDGRALLLGYANSHGRWRTLRGQWMSQEFIDENWEYPETGEPGWFETSVENDDVPNCWHTRPTHWMPLPAAPGTSIQAPEGADPTAAVRQALTTLEGWQNVDSWVWPDSAKQQAKRNTDEAVTALRAALAAQPQQAPADHERQLDAVLQERDAASDYIDALLDVVLGPDRHEWTSSYGHADAMEEVLERIASLEAAAPVQCAAEGDADHGLSSEFLAGFREGAEWAAGMVELDDPRTGDWRYDDRSELAKAIRKGPELPAANAATEPPPDSSAQPKGKEALAVPQMPLVLKLRVLADQIKRNDGLRDNAAKDHRTLIEAADALAAVQAPAPAHPQLWRDGGPKALDPTKIQLCRVGVHSADAQAMGQNCDCQPGTCRMWNGGLKPAVEAPAVKAEGDHAEFEVWEGDELFAGTSGPRDQAWAELLRYAAHCEGVVRVFEVSRVERTLSDVPVQPMGGA